MDAKAGYHLGRNRTARAIRGNQRGRHIHKLHLLKRTDSPFCFYRLSEKWQTKSQCCVSYLFLRLILGALSNNEALGPTFLKKKSSLCPFVCYCQMANTGCWCPLSCDISCDTTNPHNPIPFANQATYFNKPTITLQEFSDPPLSYITIGKSPTIARVGTLLPRYG